jgi:hypothetical protein
MAAKAEKRRAISADLDVDGRTVPSEMRRTDLVVPHTNHSGLNGSIADYVMVFMIGK